MERSDEMFENQKGIIGNDLLAIPFKIIGAGAVGSFFAMTLAKMGASDIEVWDDDKIEDHNFANQLFPIHQRGAQKVEALQSVVMDFAGIMLKQNDAKWIPGMLLKGFVVSAVDSMDVRKAIWDYCKAHKEVTMFLDARMGAQLARVYCGSPHDKYFVTFYEKSLYTSAQATADLCGQKSIIFTVLSIAGVMLNLLKKSLKREKYHNEVTYDHVTNTFFGTYAGQIALGDEEEDEDTDTEGDAVPEKQIAEPVGTTAVKVTKDEALDILLS